MQTEIWKITVTVNYPMFSAICYSIHLHTYAHSEEAAGKHTHAHRLWRKPSLCKPTSLLLSGTDLGHRWLMCPQIPRGFWSGGSSACSLTTNTNAENYWILLLYSIINGVIRITSRQCGWLRVNPHTQKWQSKQFTLSLRQLLCQHCEWLCLPWCYGCMWPDSQRWATQEYLDINRKKKKKPHSTRTRK